MTQPPPSDLTPVFRSTDPIEVSAVEAALRSEGIPAILVADPGAVPPGSVPFAAEAIGPVSGAGHRPTLVLVPSSFRRASIEIARSFRPAAPPWSPGPVEGAGLPVSRSHRTLAWLLLAATVGAAAAAAVRAVLQLTR